MVLNQYCKCNAEIISNRAVHKSLCSNKLAHSWAFGTSMMSWVLVNHIFKNC